MGRRDDDHSPSLLARLTGASEEGLNWLLVAAFLVALFIGISFLWGRFSPLIFTSSDFTVTAESFEVTPQPEWIRKSNVAGEAIVSGNLIGLNSNEAELSPRVGHAFEMHPWVRRVKHAGKRYPAKITVNLEYRRPVGMVEVDGGRLPVDSEGVLLPTVDFTKEYANMFPRIVVDQSVPVNNMAGTQWGDDRIHGAADVASLLLSDWGKLGLARIVGYRGQRNAVGQLPPYFVLQTHRGTNIIWGSAPNERRTSEPPADQKLLRLQSFAQERGGLDVIQSDQTIDLRKPGEIKVASIPDELK